MTAKTFDERLDRMRWQPNSVPTREIVDSVLGQRPAVNMRSAVVSLAGAILGILIGVALKGMVVPGTPWGPETGVTGALVGGLAIFGLCASLPLAAFGVKYRRSHPWMMQFSAMNLLIIVVLLLS